MAPGLLRQKLNITVSTQRKNLVLRPKRIDYPQRVSAYRTSRTQNSNLLCHKYQFQQFIILSDTAIYRSQQTTIV
jgi:hypothetical protein